MKIDNFLTHFDLVRARNGRYSARCPGPLHKRGDKNPSLSIKELPDGKILINCFTGCSTKDVLTAAGLTFKDLFPDNQKSTHRTNSKNMCQILKHELLVFAFAANDITLGKELNLKNLVKLKKYIPIFMHFKLQ